MTWPTRRQHDDPSHLERPQQQMIPSDAKMAFVTTGNGFPAQSVPSPCLEKKSPWSMCSIFPRHSLEGQRGQCADYFLRYRPRRRLRLLWQPAEIQSVDRHGSCGEEV